MTARDQAVAYVRSLTASDSSPEHVQSVCRLACIRFELNLSADQLRALITPPRFYGLGRVEVHSA